MMSSSPANTNGTRSVVDIMADLVAEARRHNARVEELHRELDACAEAPSTEEGRAALASSAF